jgi:hypothetical protein
MEREAAEQLARKLTREHADRETHAWFARESPDGDWSVVKVPLPTHVRRRPKHAHVEEPERRASGAHAFESRPDAG